MVDSIALLLDISCLTFLSMVSNLVMIISFICLRVSLVAISRASISSLALAMAACNVEIAVYCLYVLSLLMWSFSYGQETVSS